MDFFNPSALPPVLNDAEGRQLVPPHEVLLGRSDTALIAQHVLERKVLEVCFAAVCPHPREEILDHLGLRRLCKGFSPDNGKQLRHMVLSTERSTASYRFALQTASSHATSRATSC